MNWLQWIPMIATLALIYVLRWLHVGVINFKIFVLTILVWTLLLILFYRYTQPQPGRGQKQGAGKALEAGMVSDE